MKIRKFSKMAEGSAGPNPRPFSDFSEKMLKNENGAKFQHGHKTIHNTALKPAFSPIDSGWIELLPGFFPAPERFIKIVLWPC